MSSPAAAREAPVRRRRVPAVGVAVVLAASVLAFAALALVAAFAGPLVAHPRWVGSKPEAITGADVPVESFAAPPPTPRVHWSTPWLWWIGVALLALVVAAVLWWFVLVLRRRIPRPVAAPDPIGAAESVGAMLGSLAEAADADLGDARTFVAARAADDIVAYWEIVETAAAAAGFPRRAASTPTEFLEELVAEVGEASVAPGRPASRLLLSLYHRARFDVVALTPGAATQARAAAASVIERLARRPPAGGRSAPVEGRHT